MNGKSIHAIYHYEIEKEIIYTIKFILISLMLAGQIALTRYRNFLTFIFVRSVIVTVNLKQLSYVL